MKGMGIRITCKPGILWALASIALLGSVIGPAGAQPYVLRVAADPDSPLATVIDQARARFYEVYGVEVELMELPELAVNRLGVYRRYLEAASPEIDLYQVDAPWVGILGEHFVDMSDIIPTAPENYFRAAFQNSLVGGRLMVLPWVMNGGLLYYRADLLERYGYPAPPGSWDELEEMAYAIQDGEREAGATRFWGFLWPGAETEELSETALEWQASHGGGTLLDDYGVPRVDNPGMAAALERAQSWIGTISPDDILGMSAADARAAWLRGEAAFLRDDLTTYLLLQSDGGHTVSREVAGIAPLPTGPTGVRASTYDGWGLAVSAYSEHREMAIELALFLAGYWGERRLAVDYRLPPAMSSLYPNLEAADPTFASFRAAFENAVTRPSTTLADGYEGFSAAYRSEVWDILSSGADPGPALTRLQDAMIASWAPTGMLPYGLEMGDYIFLRGVGDSIAAGELAGLEVHLSGEIEISGVGDMPDVGYRWDAEGELELIPQMAIRLNGTMFNETGTAEPLNIVLIGRTMYRQTTNDEGEAEWDVFELGPYPTLPQEAFYIIREGEEVINGVRTFRYRVAINPVVLLGNPAVARWITAWEIGLEPEALALLIQDSQVTATLWVGVDDHIPYRIELDASGGFGSGNFSLNAIVSTVEPGLRTEIYAPVSE